MISGKKFHFALEQLKYTEVKAEAPTGLPGINIAAGVYVTDLKNFEYTFEHGHAAQEVISKLYRLPNGRSVATDQ